MLKLDIRNNIVNQENEHKSSFLIEPLESSQSISLGHLLRRVVLSNTPGIALYAVSLNDIKNEFNFINGIREDIFEIILNLKELVFSSLSGIDLLVKKINNVFLLANGPKIITAKLFQFPKNVIRIINSQKYICTLTQKKSFFLELMLKKDKGYITEQKKKTINYYKKYNNFIIVNSTFCPIKIINYNTNLCYNNNGLLKESLIFNITTNGSITPLKCLLEAIKFINDNLQMTLNQVKLIL